MGWYPAEQLISQPVPAGIAELVTFMISNCVPVITIVLWAKRSLKRPEIKSPTWNSNHQSNHSQATNHRFLDKSLAGLRHNFLVSVSIVDC